MARIMQGVDVMARTIAVVLEGRKVTVQCETCGYGAVEDRTIPPVWRPLKRRHAWRTVALRLGCGHCDSIQAERDANPVHVDRNVNGTAYL